MGGLFYGDKIMSNHYKVIKMVSGLKMDETENLTLKQAISLLMTNAWRFNGRFVGNRTVKCGIYEWYIEPQYIYERKSKNENIGE